MAISPEREPIETCGDLAVAGADTASVSEDRVGGRHPVARLSGLHGGGLHAMS